MDGSVDNRKQDLQIEPGRPARTIIGHTDGFQLPRNGEIGIIALNRAQGARRQPKLIGIQNKIAACIYKISNTSRRTNDGDTVLKVKDRLCVAAGEDGRFYREARGRTTRIRTCTRLSSTGNRRAVIIAITYGYHRGIESHRADGPNIKAAQVILTADIKAGEGGDYSAAISNGAGNQKAHPDRRRVIGANIVNRVEILGFKRWSDGVYIAAHGAPREGNRRVKIFAPGRRPCTIDSIVKERGHDLAGDNPRKGVGACQATKVDRLEI